MVNPDKFWRDKKVLITGISGFIGSRLAEHLLAERANVVGVVRGTNLDLDASLGFAGARLEMGDVCDYEFLRGVISRYEIEVIYHLAACSIVRISARDPLSAYRTNVMGTVALLEAARNVGKCSSIVVASSDKAYGDHELLPYLETHPLQPNNTYDTSKACTDMIARSYAKNYDLPVVVSRCSNVYGPGDRNFSRIVPNTIKRILSGQRPMLYSDVEEMEREFIFIDDVVRAYDCLGRIAPSAAGHAFNVGDTESLRIGELVQRVSRQLGRPDLEAEIVQRDPQFREIREQYIDAQKLQKAAGWRAEVSLNVGIDLTARWIKEMIR